VRKGSHPFCQIGKGKKEGEGEEEEEEEEGIVGAGGVCRQRERELSFFRCL
jgi:hypothetical protein